MEKENNDSARRKFLKFGLIAGGAAAIGLGLKNALLKKTPGQNVESKKVKMLTPDGKLVEVDESVVSQVSSDQARASNKELQQWIKASKI